MITTLTYRSRPSAVAWRIAAMWASRHWWVFAIPVAVAVIASLYDWRWLVACVFVALVAVPAVLAIVYYYHALSPEAAATIIPHQATINPHGITMRYIPEEGQWQPADRDIPFGEISRVEDTGDTLVAWLKGPGYRYVDIPRHAFESEHNYDQALHIMQENGIFGTKFAD